MPLEPKWEQLAALTERIYSGPEPTGDGHEKARWVFAYVRDLVLEAAKKECEGVMDRANAEAQKPHQDKLRKAYEECQANGAANCLAALHALKGDKP